MREFNVTGLCVPHMHYMVDVSQKLAKIIKMIDQGKYFTINRARQFGKTTMLNQIFHALKDKYVIIEISFEAIGEKAFSSEAHFCDSFISMVSKTLHQYCISDQVISEWEQNKELLHKLEELSDKISYLVGSMNKDTLLLIDEVDKSSNNQLFMGFLGMLRNKFLDRNKGKDITFKSVILASVYDVKNLKVKLRPDAEKKFNSPWNIASNFDVDMSFNTKEIATMLIDYCLDTGVEMEIDFISKWIYEYTNGYPFLVSRLCKAIDEELGKKWTEEGLEEAVQIMLYESNTLFDDLFKNLENNKELYDIIFDILINNKEIVFNIDNPTISLANMFSILKEHNRKAVVHNRIFEIRIYNYLISKMQTSGIKLENYASASQFIDSSGDLNIEQVLSKFQELLQEEYRQKDQEFLEREGRLLFLAFLKPIINGTGFYFVEPQTRDNMRLDLVITYNKKLYIIELKKWYGKDYEDRSHDQLAQYLEVKNLERGYLIIFDFRKLKKVYTKNWLDLNGKKIYEVIV